LEGRGSKNTTPLPGDVSESPVMIEKANADLKYMKETMKQDNKNKLSNEYFDFQAKVNTILEE